MDQDEIKKKIDQIVTSIGATCEFLSTLRTMLISKDFTREEAVKMCSEVLVAIITKGQDK